MSHPRTSRHPHAAALALAFSLALLGVAAARPADAGATWPTARLVSTDSSGQQGSRGSYCMCDISADNRWLVLASSDGLDPRFPDAGDGSYDDDLFIRDRLTGSVRQISVSLEGNDPRGRNEQPSMSADGRFVAYESASHDMFPNLVNNALDRIVVYDRLADSNELVSVTVDGDDACCTSEWPSISGDGRYVAFQSTAWGLVPPGQRPGFLAVYVRDRSQGVTIAVGAGERPSISADGRSVAYYSPWDVHPDDTNGHADIYLYDLVAGTTEVISVATDGSQANGGAWRWRSPISADGRYVAFTTEATNLAAPDTNGRPDAFVRDRVSGTTTRISILPGGVEPNSGSETTSISADGRYVSFISYSSNIGVGDVNATQDVFVYDQQTSIISQASVTYDGQRPNRGISGGYLSPDASLVLYNSDASNMVEHDTNGNRHDVFERDWLAPPTQPLNPRTVAPSPGTASITVAWNRPITDSGAPIVAYQIHRSTSRTGPTSLIATVPASQTNYLDHPPGPGIYHYRITAENSHGQGAQSQNACAAPGPAGAIPAIACHLLP